MAFDIKIQVEAIDRASAVLQVVRESIGNLGLVSDRVSSAMKGIASVADVGSGSLKGFTGAAEAAPAGVRDLETALARTAIEVGQISGGGAAASQAIAALGQRSAESSPAIAGLSDALARIQKASGLDGSLGQLAEAAGTSIDSLREFEEIARQQGATISELGAGFSTLAQRITEAKDPTSEAARNFRALGIDIQQLSDSQRTIGGALPLVAKGFAKLGSGAGRAQIALGLLGENATKLTPVLAEIAGRAATGRFSNFEAALKLVGLTLKDVEQKGEQHSSTFTRVGEVIKRNTLLFSGFAAAIASVPASLGLLTRGAINTGDSLNDIATSTGISVEFLSGLDLAARQNGTSLDELIFGFKGLSKQMIDAQDDGSEAARIFRILGINIRTLTDDEKRLESFLPRLADGFTRLAKGPAKIDIAQTLLGRSGPALLPLLEQGSEGIRRTQERAQALGSVLSGETARAADEFNDKLAELTGIFKALGLQIAEVALPYLRSFVEFATEHATTVKVGFLGISAAVTGLGLALVGLKAATALDSLLTAIAGPAALARVSSMSGLLLVLKEGFLNLLAPLGSVATATNGAFGLAVITRIGLVGGAIAALGVTIWTLVEGWRAYRASQAEAIAARNLQEQNVDLKGRTEKLIQQFKVEGKITDAQASSLQDKLNKAFQPKTIQVPKVGLEGSIADRVFGRKPVQVKSAAEDQSRAIIAVQKELRKQLGGDNVTAVEAVRIAKTELEIAQAKLEVIKTTSATELQTLQIEQEKQFSTVTAEEFARRRLEINQRVHSAEIEQINKRQRLESNEVVRQATLKFAPIKDDTERQKAISNETAQAVELIATKANADRAQVISESVQTELQIRSNQSTAELEIEKRTTQFRLEEAQSRHDELKASEIQFQLELLEIGEKIKNLPVSQQSIVRDELVSRKLRERQERDASIRETEAKRRLDLQQTIFQSELSLAQNDPTPNAAAKQQRINDLLRQQNELIQTEIELSRKRLAVGGLSAEDEVQRKRRLVELEAQQITNRRAANIQEPTNLPQLQGALGFQNQLDQFGNKTGERELIAPFRALDDFLTGTLQTTFNGLSQSLAGLVTGATTWAQVWTQAGNQIIGMIVQLILEYTVFHQIRSALDSIFHKTAKTNIATTAAAGKVAQVQAAATGATAAGTVTAAGAPAAAATSIWSFGSSATIGLALALAAIGAIVGALAFAKGGVVPERRQLQAFASGGVTAGGVFRGPGGPTDDKIVTTARPGTGILTASAVQHFGGQRFVSDLLARRLPVPWSTGKAGGAPAIPETNWTPPGGQAIPIRVSSGEAQIPPETVAHYGGPRFIEMLNQRQLPAALFQPNLPQKLAKQAAFAGGGVVESLRELTVIGGAGAIRSINNLEMPQFDVGGIVGDLDLSHLEVPHFAEGGAVGVDPSNTQGARVNQILRATVESNPTINTPESKFNFFFPPTRQAMLDAMRSSDGRAIVIDMVNGMKTELGIRT